ncbi:MAG TPA: hypothetical protein VGB68_16305 [Pyrinomonadaceae bacterium]|jgi:hypothetical protein
MKITLTVLLILFFNLILQSGSGCGGEGGNGGGSQCPTPFYPPYDVRVRFDPYQGGIVVSWNERGYKDGYQVFRCVYNCVQVGQDGKYYANLGSFEAITNNRFAGTFYVDKNLSHGTTYHYAIQNRYQSCGVNWSTNYATITAP